MKEPGFGMYGKSSHLYETANHCQKQLSVSNDWKSKSCRCGTHVEAHICAITCNIVHFVCQDTQITVKVHYLHKICTVCYDFKCQRAQRVVGWKLYVRS